MIRLGKLIHDLLNSKVSIIGSNPKYSMNQLHQEIFILKKKKNLLLDIHGIGDLDVQIILLNINMSSQDKIEEEIIVTGSLFTITLFEEKLMRNFLLISNKLRKLEGLTELQQRNRALEKELRFVNMKVDTLIQKLPKEGNSINRNDIRTISKDLFFQLLNSNDEKLGKSKFNSQIQAEIAKLKEQMTKISKIQYSSNADYQSNRFDKSNDSKVGFAGGQSAREKQSEKQRKNIEVTKENLKKVLDPNEEEILNSIMDGKAEKKRSLSTDKNQELISRLDRLQKNVEELRLGRGYASFLQKEIQHFKRYEEVEQKSSLNSRKTRQKYYELERAKKQKEKLKQEAEIAKKTMYLQVQKMDLKRQSISKEDVTQRSTVMKSFLVKEKNLQKDPKLQISNQIKEIKEKRREKNEESFKRTSSIKKLDPIEKRLKIDDFKELTNILRSVELKVQSKVSQEIYLGFVKDFEQKLEVIKLSRDTATEINEVRKNIFALQSKIYSVIEYLQNLTKEDDGLIVKKKWTCISCDKNIQNYQGKIGQHLNWETVNAKKMSPSKVAGFGQTGQFATKIRNLIEGSDAE